MIFNKLNKQSILCNNYLKYTSLFKLLLLTNYQKYDHVFYLSIFI